ncbi:hypothetical protein [Solirubrobacter deserti]|uniref:Calcium-binding protein n=1 Tax=Solirubrobacter deserti TaxID=2282478 RepID=A0ABT4RRK7_9ACTN|nr:hypothetical protein [Solirubrobacter deserti]MDA0141028.1 hypothetical protein [Solirubrobacter deserti]
MTVAADLGPGNDTYEVTAPAASVSGGPGDDHVEAFNSVQGYVGPITVDGGPGNDTLQMLGRGPGMTLIGGEGDDVLGPALTNPYVHPIDLVCGPGNDRVTGEPQDRFGDGCARPVTGLTRLSRVSRVFAKGRLEVPMRTMISVRRRTHRGDLDLPALARRTLNAPAGPLRARLKTTAAGKRLLRRDPTPLVWVFIETRTASDRTRVIFKSRLG